MSMELEVSIVQGRLFETDIAKSFHDDLFGIYRVLLR